jgi:hypothetical protein
MRKENERNFVEFLWCVSFLFFLKKELKSRLLPELSEVALLGSICFFFFLYRDQDLREFKFFFFLLKIKFFTIYFSRGSF